MRNRASKIPVLLVVSRDAELRRRLGRAVWAGFSVHQRGGKTGLEAALRELKPAILLLDLEVRRLGGVRGLPKIQKLSPSTRIIVFTHSPKRTEEISAIKQGAKGYIKTDISPNMLRKAVNAVRNGEVWAGRKILASLIEENMALRGDKAEPLSNSAKSSLDQLSFRKRQIVRLVVEDATNKMIASRLNISEATVKAHLTGIFRKLNISHRLQLAILVTAETKKASSFLPDPFPSLQQTEN